MELEKSFTRKKMYHLDHHRRLPSKIIGWKNWIQMSLEVVKTPNKSNQNPKPNYQARRDLWVSNHLVCLPRKSEKMSCLAAKAQERWDLWMDNQQLDDIDIDFRVSGLPHAVVKQAENFRFRELVKKIESHPHREALQADLQQNNVYNPPSDDSKAMIRELGNVLNVFSFGIKQWSIALADTSWLKANPAKNSQIKTGCSLCPALRDQERALSWRSTRQNRRTERVPYCLDCVEEMLQESWLSRWTFYMYSRSIS